jgi:hypothetical protein
MWEKSAISIIFLAICKHNFEFSYLTYISAFYLYFKFLSIIANLRYGDVNKVNLMTE